MAKWRMPKRINNGAAQDYFLDNEQQHLSVLLLCVSSIAQKLPVRISYNFLQRQRKTPLNCSSSKAIYLVFFLTRHEKLHRVHQYLLLVISPRCFQKLKHVIAFILVIKISEPETSKLLLKYICPSLGGILVGEKKASRSLSSCRWFKISEWRDHQFAPTWLLWSWLEIFLHFFLMTNNIGISCTSWHSLVLRGIKDLTCNHRVNICLFGTSKVPKTTSLTGIWFPEAWEVRSHGVPQGLVWSKKQQHVVIVLQQGRLCDSQMICKIIWER